MAGVSARTKLIMNQALKEKNIIDVNEHNTHTENNDNEGTSKNLESDDALSTFDDSDADKNYVDDDTSSTDESNCDYEKNSKKKRNKLQCDLVIETEQTVSNEHIIEDGSNLENMNIETAITTDTQEENSKQHTNNNKTFAPTSAVTENENNEEITKKKITKRLSLTEKLKRDKSKHPMRNKCEGKCKRDCVKLTEENRQDIWDKFWSLDYTSRRKWMSKHIKLVPVKRKLASAAHQRSESRTFSLPHRDFTEVPVCRLTFLNTLGYTNDSVITELVAAIKRAPCGGHTHMSADGIHGNIEKKIGRKRNIYDFQELVEVITTSRTNVFVLELNKFHLWKSEKRVTTKKDDTMKGFLLNPLVEVKFIKGSRYMKYKTDFDEEFREIDFLKKKHTVPHTPESVALRGVKAVKKQTILNELVPLMPLNRRQFWESLPDSEASLDLVRSEQILDT